jgi:hypothetical protein
MYLYEKEVNQVAYWRKANAIHGWIIDRTGGIDDCTPIDLRKQDLYDLREVCIEVLSDPDKAEKLLPPASGFFFGSTAIDEWYWNDIQETVNKLNTIIEQSVEDATFEYQASW